MGKIRIFLQCFLIFLYFLWLFINFLVTNFCLQEGPGYTSENMWKVFHLPPTEISSIGLAIHLIVPRCLEKVKSQAKTRGVKRPILHEMYAMKGVDVIPIIISTGKKAFHAGKKSGKNYFAPSEKFSCYAHAWEFWRWKVSTGQGCKRNIFSEGAK